MSDSCWRCLCRECSTGVYSCKSGSLGNGKCAYHWFSAIALVSFLSLCWMYIWLVAFNDQDDVNWKVFIITNSWGHYFRDLIIISATLTGYCFLLLFAALVQIALKEPLNLHFWHKIAICCGVIFIIFGVIGITVFWPREWPTIPLSLQAIGPFLQFGAVGALTLVSPFVFRGFHIAKQKRSKSIIAAVFVVVSAVIFLCPLCIWSPCLIKWNELPEKPKLIGHRGAPMLAPENTLMSFNRSIACDVTAFETDVQLSKDRVPFLMHDNNTRLFLSRTTDADDKFADKDFNSSSNLSWKELQTLNAGESFLEKDPFLSVSKLSEEELETARNQSIPSLLQLLNLAKQHNISVMFDLYSTDEENDTMDTVNTILESGIDPSLVLWLPPKKREHVIEKAPGFIQVYDNESDMRNKTGDHLNVRYSALSMKKIRELRRENITVNLWVVNERWLFSLLWCAGASSVTTNSCHLLKDMEKPDLVLDPWTYTVIWITVDAVAFLIMAVLFICQR